MTRLIVSTPFLAVLLLSGAVVAQHGGHDHGGHDHGKADKAKAVARSGYAYPFATCPISGKKLGAMGKPKIKVYDGREVRYCCGGCTGKFEKDLAKSFAKIDAKVIKDQMALYPLTNSVVTGKKLPKRTRDFVFGNRLVRVGSAKEEAKFRKSPAKFFAVLDKAVVATQGKKYALSVCPVSGEDFGGEMGKPIDLVVAGRLVRVCCDDCVDDVDDAPSEFIAKVDAAAAKKGHDHKDGNGGKKGHDHKGGHGH